MLQELKRIALYIVFCFLTSCATVPPSGYRPPQNLGQRLAQATQLRETAEAHYRQQDYEQAASFYHSVLALLEQSLSPTHLAVALAANDLAEVQRANGQYTAAEALYQRALDILDTTPPKEPQHLAAVLNNFGLLNLDIGKYTDAEALLLRALNLRREVFETDRASIVKNYNNLALLYKTMGRYAEALEFYGQALDLLESLAPQNDRTLAITLGNLGTLQLEFGHYLEAESLFHRAFKLQEEILGKSHPGLATPLNNLASLYHNLGEYAKANALYRRALSLQYTETQTQYGLDATSLLNNLGSLYASLGDYAKAEQQFRRVLATQRKHLAAQHPMIADSLSNLAWVSQIQGQYSEAEALYQQALEIRQQAFGPRHMKVAHSLRNLGDLALITGAFGRAESRYQQAREIIEGTLGANHPDVALTLNNLALLYRILGDYSRAERLYNQALYTFETVLGENHPYVALTLNNLALLFYYQEDYARAEPLVRRAIAIQARSLPPAHPDIAINRVALGRILLEKGEYPAAQQQLERALASQQQALGEHHPRVAFALNVLAQVRQARGDRLPAATNAKREYALAKQFYYRALTIATGAGEPEVLWRIQYNLSRLFEAIDNTNAAIFYGYEAVTTLQGLRQAASSLDKELQQSFLQERYQVYRHLADLLISQDYIPEAQQVLGLLKAAEYFDFVRRSGEQQDKATIDLEGIEFFSSYYRFRDDLVEIHRRYQTELDLAILETDSSKDKVIKEIKNLIGTAKDRFIAYLTTLESQLVELDLKQKYPSLGMLLKDKEIFKGIVIDLGQGWAMIHTLITNDGIHLILTTQNAQLVRFSKVNAIQLQNTIADFRMKLEKGSDLDSLQSTAAQLYDWVLAPLESDLIQADVHSLALSLDGSLRYVPFAALYDGLEYLAESYNVVMYTEAGKHRFTADSENWRVAGLGASKAPPTNTQLKALPAVKIELNNIVKEEQKQNDEGVLPGIIFFDEKFTVDKFQKVLDSNKYSVLHVASHFSLNNGDMTSCKLFLGSGKELSLGIIKENEEYHYEFNNKQLVTLSACNTAVGRSAFGSGMEVESFGALAQKKGAKSVLATLWTVHDKSTGHFMQLFYNFREKCRLTKAEALRQAQLAMLRGEWRDSEGVVRGVVPVGGANITEVYGHPYHWAPFVLMGNPL